MVSIRWYLECLKGCLGGAGKSMHMPKDLKVACTHAGYVTLTHTEILMRVSQYPRDTAARSLKGTLATKYGRSGIRPTDPRAAITSAMHTSVPKISTWTPNVCTMMALWALPRGFGPLIYALWGLSR